MKPKYELLRWAIKNTKLRIQHAEKHGNGDMAIHEKAILKKILRNKEIIDGK